jgi:predicted porin
VKRSLIAYSILLLPATAMAELTVEPYGSLRIQAEQVSVDQARAGEDDSYSGFRDAYSRFGVNASYPLANGTTLGGKIEIPFNTAQMKVEDPSFFQESYKNDEVNNAPRVYKLTASGNWGSAAIGKQWLAYYNNIGYPVDYFSSIYSGYATYATFRREAVTYTTPTFSGFSLTGSAVDMVDGGGEAYLDTNQFALSYAMDGLNMALAYQDSIDTKADLLGASASYKTGPWRFATKIEQFDSTAGTTNPDPLLYNLYASYKLNNYTFKAHYAKGDTSLDSDTGETSAFFQGDTYQLGADYQYTKNLKVFVEYFYEERAYAIYLPDSVSSASLSDYHADTNGSALLVGARYDF